MPKQVLFYFRKLIQWPLWGQMILVFLFSTLAIVTSLCFLHSRLLNQHEFLFYILSSLIIVFFVGLMVLWVTFFIIKPVSRLTQRIYELAHCEKTAKHDLLIPHEFLCLHSAVVHLVTMTKEQIIREELLQQTEVSLKEANAKLRQEISKKETAESDLKKLNFELEKRIKKRTKELYKEVENYRVLFEESPVSIWEEDFSEIMRYVNKLKRSGVDDFRVYFDEHPEEVDKCLQYFKVSDVNQATVHLFEAGSKQEFLDNFGKILVDELKVVFKEALIALVNGEKTFSAKSFTSTLIGRKIYFDLRLLVVKGYEKNCSKVLMTLTDITELKHAEEKLSFLAMHDVLTHLPNRSLFEILLKKAVSRSNRTRLSVGVMYIDLDSFKSVNDHFGHEAGDRLLTEVAKKLKLLVREDDVVARVGGDEFVIILNQLKHIDDALLIADKINKQLVFTYKIKRKRLEITPSIGLVIYPDHTKDVDNLIQLADKAMYSVKQNGKNSYQLYNTEII